LTSFLYPRIISISRQARNTTVGAQPYSGIDASTETQIANGIAAKIQADRQGTESSGKLPTDSAGQSIWKIIFKAPLGLVENRDFITDDQGLRYQVIAAYWGPMVTTCRCQIMES